ncbi:MAG TPA: hypothetical protein VIJ65_10975 [Acidobacteriaceae bacterium]
MSWLVCTLLMMAGLCAYGQDMPASFPAKLTEAPVALPAGCSAALVAGLHDAMGTPSYRWLHREIASLKLGHAASQELQTAVSRQGTPGGGVLHEVVPVMTGLADAQSTYLCASFVAGQETGGDASRRGQVGSLVSVYNRMAVQTWRLENVLSSEAAAKSGQDAGRSASILQDRKQTGEDLVNAVTAEEKLLIDTDGPGGEKADWLRITCNERSRLLNELVTLTKGTAVDEFTVAGGLLQGFLGQPHKCIP